MRVACFSCTAVRFWDRLADDDGWCRAALAVSDQCVLCVSLSCVIVLVFVRFNRCVRVR